MRLIRASVPALTSLLLWGACNSDRFLVGDLDFDAGAGGAVATGGTSATGGSPGAGGTVATGGAPGAGGEGSGKGGAMASASGGAGGDGGGPAADGGTAILACGPAPLPVRTLAISAEQVADRLARFLRGDRADNDLIQRATAAATNADVVALARTLLDDGTAQPALERLLTGWLELDHVTTVTPDPEVASLVDADLRASMREETRRFMMDVLRTRGSTLATMLTAPFTYVNDRLSVLYGLPAPVGWTRVATDPAQRAGLLTQASFLFTKPRATGRGAWLHDKLLCQQVPPSPPNTIFPPVMQGPTETYREAHERSLDQAVCAACHSVIDPPGFAFENYDPIGRYRATDHGKPIDSSGVLFGRENQEIRFTSALDMDVQLAASCDVQSCLAQVFLSQALGGALRESDESSQKELVAAWAAAGFELRELLVLATGTRSFLAP
jgi:hypothetical protein